MEQFMVLAAIVRRIEAIVLEWCGVLHVWLLEMDFTSDLGIHLVDNVYHHAHAHDVSKGIMNRTSRGFRHGRPETPPTPIEVDAIYLAAINKALDFMIRHIYGQLSALVSPLDMIEIDSFAPGFHRASNFFTILE
jgi:hypothetical protein